MCCVRPRRDGIKRALEAGMDGRLAECKELFKRELARCLGPMLRDIPTEQFEELLDRMATLQCQHEVRLRPDNYDGLRQR